MSLSSHHLSLLRSIQTWGQGEARTYMPYRKDERSYRSLEKSGFCRYRTIDEPGITYNGYQLTEKGKKAI